MTVPTLLLLAASTALPERPHHDEVVFETASQLVGWCRQEVQAYFVAKAIPTYQIVTSHKSEGRMLIVEGKIRANGRDTPFTCRVAKGARERYAYVVVD